MGEMGVTMTANEHVFGYYARCGGNCDAVLHFPHADDMESCSVCGAVCDLSVVVVEYKTVAMRAVQIEGGSMADLVLNDLASFGWRICQFQTVREPGGSHVLLVYILERLIAHKLR